MQIYADAAFRCGSTHEVCQDYARAGDTCVAVSDGCSSAPDTDIGARALVLSALQALPVGQAGDNLSCDEAHLRRWIVQSASYSLPRSISKNALLGTLMSVTWDGAGFRTTCWGDGVVGISTSGDVFNVNVVECENSAPPYPIYENPEGPEMTIRQLVVSADDVEDLGGYRTPFGGWDSWVNRSIVSVAFVGSDGWCSFVDADRRPVAVGDVLKEFFPFRSSGQAFVRRRLGVFLRRCQKLGWTHTDDLSIAAIQVLK